MSWWRRKIVEPYRSDLFSVKDIDLPPANRGLANYFQAKYNEALVELRKANKGCERLRRKLDRMRKRLESNQRGE